ncbi:MAG: hypothetical protein ABH864_04350, partial [archaeon]
MVKKRIILVLLVLVLACAFVLAAHTVTLSDGTASTSVLEDGSNFYNISINNSDDGQPANITQVNVTLPASFSVSLETNGTDAFGSFSVDGQVLSWSNLTEYLVNGTEIKYFWFNATASTPGAFNITVVTLNSTDSVYNNITVVVNDSAVPSTVDFVTPTDTSGENLSRSYLVYNVSATDDGTLDTLTVYLFNSTYDQINTSMSATSPLFGNFSGLGGGVYYMNASANDSVGNTNYTIDTRTFTVDTTVPVPVFGDGTLPDYTNITQTNVYVNVSVTETNEKNITFTLYNSTSEENSTTFTDGTRTINWTGLSDGAYTYNVTVYDY